MADQLPIISGTRAINTTATASTSLIGRGLSAIQRKETGIARTELDARYRQVRDSYNRITDYGKKRRFNADLLPKQDEMLEDKQLLQLQPFLALLHQLADVFTVFQQLADTGYGKAYFPLASMYQGRQGVSKNNEKVNYYSRLAFDWCFANQALNDPEIWRDLGFIYFNGRGVVKDNEQAVFWYRKAAEQGYAAAQCDLGYMYNTGQGVSKNDEQAVFWYRKAAEQGYVTAQNNLGSMYFFARGLSKEDEQGYATPQRNGFGYMYFIGRDVSKDDEQAVFWCRKAAEQGDKTAQNNLGMMYFNGRGVSKDDEQAAFWCRKASEQGYAAAQCDLGYMYFNGLGVEQDDEQAIFWYRKAAEQGYARAQENLTKLGINWKDT